MEWIYFGKATCPLTRVQLHPEDFIPNESLEQEIKQWKKDNSIAECQDDMDCSCSCRVHIEQEKPEPVVDLKNLMRLRKKVLQNRDARLQTSRHSKC